MIEYAEKDGGILFTVRVVPRASQSKIVGEHQGALRVRIAAPPVDGAANEVLVHTLARAFDVSRSAVRIVAGQTSKLKRIRIQGVSGECLIKLGKVTNAEGERLRR